MADPADAARRPGAPLPLAAWQRDNSIYPAAGAALVLAGEALRRRPASRRWPG